ncbi:MAG: uroporphyrinogen-III C-methyltransferase [Ramlibacter sp.]|nr:uroporphyrinogen-III C-methyltransferase [Ramlibacter sp.]
MSTSPTPLHPVSLVGAGPGAADLLTVRALQRLQQADVVLYDLLVSPEILALLPKNCERICVGKRSSRHTLPQAEINRLIVAQARLGRRVVRLKGGDPFIFGRGGEEMQELAAAGIPCEVVPAVTAAMGAAAASGIPLTHRDHAQMVSFVTGHRRMDDGAAKLDWIRLLNAESTLVIYMGLGEATRIAAELMEHGEHAADTPMAIVSSATTPQQHIVHTTLGELPQALQDERLVSPALLIIGSVTTLHEELYPLIVQAQAMRPAGSTSE